MRTPTSRHLRNALAFMKRADPVKVFRIERDGVNRLIEASQMLELEGNENVWKLSDKLEWVFGLAIALEETP